MPTLLHHLFVCTNTRPPEKRESCGAKGAEELRKYLKSRAKELRLPATRVNLAGCLNRCEEGPALVVYPQGEWFRCASRQDADAILAYLQGSKRPEALALPPGVDAPAASD